MSRFRETAAEAAYRSAARVSTPPRRRWWLRLALAALAAVAVAVLVPAVRQQAFMLALALAASALVVRNAGRR
jgi:hypothetical protein